MPSKLAAPRTITPALLPIIEQAYGFSITWLETKGAITRLYTNEGIFDVTITDLPFQALEFTSLAGRFLQEKGYHQLLDIRLCKSGELGIRHHETGCILTKGTKGHKANLLHAAEREKVMCSLAKFHLCSEQFLNFDSPSIIDFPNWRKQILKSFHELETLRHGSLQLFAKFDQEIWHGAQQAVEGFMGNEYDLVVQLENERKGFVHGDIRIGSFWIEEDCFLKLPDDFTLRRDFRIYDIFCSLQDVMRQTKWDRDLGQMLIKLYESIAPLEKEEMVLLRNWILFPWRYLDVAAQILSEGPSDLMHYRLMQECTMARKRMQFAKGLLE